MLEIGLAQRLDGKAGPSQSRTDRPGKVAAASQRLPDRFYPLLPAGYAGVGRAPVLKEKKLSTRCEDAPQFGKYLCRILDRTQCVGADHGIERTVRERNILPDALPNVGFPALGASPSTSAIKEFLMGIDT